MTEYKTIAETNRFIVLDRYDKDDRGTGLLSRAGIFQFSFPHRSGDDRGTGLLS